MRIPVDKIEWSLAGLKVSGDDPQESFRRVLWGAAIDPRLGIGWLERTVADIHAELTAMAENDGR